MAIPKPPPPALQIVAVFSRYGTAIDWVADRISRAWGVTCLQSARFDHSETSYYQAEMGQDLEKQFFVQESVYNPAELAKTKLQSNQWERELAETANFPEVRPVNIDPGYLTLTKLVLASAKDRAHRIYLDHGIYAEESLYYLNGWQSRPWTYPDYQRNDFQEFFEQARELLKQRIKQRGE